MSVFFPPAKGWPTDIVTQREKQERADKVAAALLGKRKQLEYPIGAATLIMEQLLKGFARGQATKQ